jgi:hypothetical protein
MKKKNINEFENISLLEKISNSGWHFPATSILLLIFGIVILVRALI